jgi:hypothetical protein
MPRTHRQSVVVPGTSSIPPAPANPHTTALVFSIFCQAIMMIASPCMSGLAQDQAQSVTRPTQSSFAD